MVGIINSMTHKWSEKCGDKKKSFSKCSGWVSLSTIHLQNELGKETSFPFHEGKVRRRTKNTIPNRFANVLRSSSVCPVWSRQILSWTRNESVQNFKINPISTWSRIQTVRHASYRETNPGDISERWSQSQYIQIVWQFRWVYFIIILNSKFHSLYYLSRFRKMRWRRHPSHIYKDSDGWRQISKTDAETSFQRENSNHWRWLSSQCFRGQHAVEVDCR